MSTVPNIECAEGMKWVADAIIEASEQLGFVPIDVWVGNSKAVYDVRRGLTLHKHWVLFASYHTYKDIRCSVLSNLANDLANE